MKGLEKKLKQQHTVLLKIVHFFLKFEARFGSQHWGGEAGESLCVPDQLNL